MSDINALRIDAFRVTHPGVDVQKGKYLRRWSHLARFGEDIPRSSINRFCEYIGEEAEWTFSEGFTLYYNNELISKMVSAVANDVFFRRVVTEKEALRNDACGPWRDVYEYRVFLPKRARPSPEELLKKLRGARPDMILETIGHQVAPDGAEQPIEEVIAVLTSDDELMVLLKMLLPGVIVEVANAAKPANVANEDIGQI